jgi:CPA1 family monovalent cation:H+ antiporter
VIDPSVVIALLAAITLLAGLAARTGTPYPVVLVVGGLFMGLVPGIPAPRLSPDLVLVVFLPPLLYASAFQSSVDELRANAGPILLLAVGLVLATVGGVAVVAVLVAGLPWAVAFVLGAVLGPTDPVSASAIMQRLGRRSAS